MPGENGKEATRVIAFHLPQFHCIPENDEWWGEGFTEWVNTRKAEKLYEGHYQPRTPLGEKYYDLTRESDLRWEMELARRYGLQGFCYYHYWFSGKLLLEKPLEIMRELPERLPYCFCWANEPWIRSWQGSDEVLIDQAYPGESDWEAHYRYLRNFFLDERYIRVEGKPVLVLYKTESIRDCDQMIAYWDRNCKADGFEGIYIIEEKNGFQSRTVCGNSTAYLEFEPLFTNKFCRNNVERALDYAAKRVFNRRHGTNALIYRYDRVWRNIVRRKHEEVPGKAICPGAFVDWDNTARKGKRATFFLGATPEKFGRYFGRQVKRAREDGAPFVFINAWNEWGEGTYLEPDERYAYAYLEQLRQVVGTSGS